MGPDAHAISLGPSLGPAAVPIELLKEVTPVILRTTRTEDLRRVSGVTGLTYRRHVEVQLVVMRLEAP
jgi:hypothetical protein